MQIRFAALCCTCAALWLQPAIAQQQAQVNPADPDAAAPSPQYRSAFDGYQPFRDEKLRPWRDINEDVARTGGHIGIFGGSARADHGTHPAPRPARPGAAK